MLINIAHGGSPMGVCIEDIDGLGSCVCHLAEEITLNGGGEVATLMHVEECEYTASNQP